MTQIDARRRDDTDPRAAFGKVGLAGQDWHRAQVPVVTPRDWTAQTQEAGVSDTFVFFRDLPLDGWEAWLDARDADTEQPSWSDLDGWEQSSVFSVVVMERLVLNANDLRSLRIAWRLCAPERGSDADWRFSLMQERAIALGGPDEGDPLRDRTFFAADGRPANGPIDLPTVPDAHG